MTLLICTFAAIAATLAWYRNLGKADYRLGTLVLMYWGASLMWFVDAVFAYMELGVGYFSPSAEEMLNDSFLGFSVVAFGLLIWLVLLFVQDPDGKIKKLLLLRKQ